MSFKISSELRQKGVFVVAAGAVLLAPGLVAAQEGPSFEAALGITSEYMGKGLGKSFGEAVNGEIGAEWGDFHASVFASTAKLSQGSDAEIVTTAGWAPKAAGFSFDFAVVNRDLPGTNPGVQSNYWEYQADVSRKFGRVSARVRVNYTEDGFAGTREAWWNEVQLGTALTSSDRLTVAVGSRRAHGGADYTAWNVGVKHAFNDKIAADVRWYDTSKHGFGEAYEGRLVGALTYAF